MLQILTGKFFPSTDAADLYVTNQRGVLFSNYVLPHPIETRVGTLQPTDGAQSRRPAHLVYEVEQRLPKRNADGTPSFVVACGIESLLRDFAALVSFELEVTCSENAALVRRLRIPPSDDPLKRGLPSSYVPRVFDSEVRWSSEDGPRINSFVDELVGLPRQQYEAVLRAVHRYVTGLHRLADDVDLAYTLLVASIESLAQRFDEFDHTWDGIPAPRRGPVDEALADAPGDVAARVRDAILKSEHPRLSHRYREFSLAHIPDSFFRVDAVGGVGPIPRRTLGPALDQAYSLRSSNVHTLSKLPDPLAFSPARADYVTVEGLPVLTVAGLARVARAVIREFVHRTPKVETEAIDYRKHMPGTVRLQLSETMWLSNPSNYDHTSAPHYLAAFLKQLALHMTSTSKGEINDLSLVLVEVANQIKGVSLPQRRAMLTLYLIYGASIQEDQRPDQWEAFVDRHLNVLDDPSIEALLAVTLVDLQADWTPADAESTFTDYLSNRFRKTGFRIPPLFEAAVALRIAEMYRQAGDHSSARRMIREAVELYPGCDPLISLEQIDPLPAISWADHLDLPDQRETETGGVSPADAAAEETSER